MERQFMDWPYGPAHGCLTIIADFRKSAIIPKCVATR
jgi:hypothetical protein